MNLAGYVARIREVREMCTQFLLECFKVRDYSVHVDVDDIKVGLINSVLTCELHSSG
jgi:hypothetical protein